MLESLEGLGNTGVEDKMCIFLSKLKCTWRMSWLLLCESLGGNIHLSLVKALGVSDLGSFTEDADTLD